jgi:PadR family transcriptional regulator AphA
MEPTAVTWAVLGLLALRPMSGYDIKQAVDRTIRHFWAASYTGKGRRELRGWLTGHETRIELRDESLLRLFFADTLPRDHGLGLLAARREGYRAMLEYLRSLDDGTGPDPPFVDLVYRWALDYCEWGIEWCNRQERRLRRAA